MKNSKKRTFNQLKTNTESLVSYEEVRENFIGINEAEAVQTPTANDQASNKSYVDTTASNTMSTAAMIHATKQELADYLKKDGSDPMTGNLNMHGRQTNIQSASSNGCQTTNTIGFY